MVDTVIICKKCGNNMDPNNMDYADVNVPCCTVCKSTELVASQVDWMEDN